MGDVVVNGQEDSAVKALFARWKLLRADDPHALPFPLGPGWNDQGELYAAIVEGDPSLDDSLHHDPRAYRVLAPWFGGRLLAVPTTTPSRWICVGLLEELNGAEALLLEGRPQAIATVALAANAAIGTSSEALQYARLAYQMVWGLRRGAAWLDAAAEDTIDGWRVRATTRWDDHVASSIVPVTRDGSVTIDERTS